jgi:hypothetical protein
MSQSLPEPRAQSLPNNRRPEAITGANPASLVFTIDHHRRQSLFYSFQAVIFVMSRQDVPANGCKASKEGLMTSKHKLDETDDCPNCSKLGVACFVSNHPVRLSTGNFLA